ncbi:uncharacterized protein AMSG_03063 [Thecamonas trahens ATCC 50062]|uniref:Saposin B-type domain-containing protein n=1 Tax=Thecamonas trahens ATCC 50062 TaxID=461836 RepID=A0A0L0D374_THETB|nr:hypothetical protein AMSG_03063 [Thecamonas trahens ATCC 50062]KNC46626.1 hypothetical protein AMSG_03063 [Thecamonas trahens ATCC 50062]|eukprot:XP_013760399.1 hypothetical protein AMSG_03063 [Thecamonas trahens ATCC 50062]
MFKLVVALVLVAALASSAAASVPASLSADDEAMFRGLQEKYLGVLCDKCMLKQQELMDEFAALNRTVAACTAHMQAKSCSFGVDATEDALCLDAVAQLCLDAANAVEPAQTCASVGICQASTPPQPKVAAIWGECGLCQDTIGEGIKLSEKYLCKGLSAGLSTFCDAGAPICDAVLNKGCDMLVHWLCDSSCMATWVCHGFHACSKGPSKSCCHH